MNGRARRTRKVSGSGIARRRSRRARRGAGPGAHAQLGLAVGACRRRSRRGPSGSAGSVGGASLRPAAAAAAWLARTAPSSSPPGAPRSTLRRCSSQRWRARSSSSSRLRSRRVGGAFGILARRGVAALARWAIAARPPCPSGREEAAGEREGARRRGPSGSHLRRPVARRGRSGPGSARGCRGGLRASPRRRDARTKRALTMPASRCWKMM